MGQDTSPGSLRGSDPIGSERTSRTRAAAAAWQCLRARAAGVAGALGLASRPTDAALLELADWHDIELALRARRQRPGRDAVVPRHAGEGRAVSRGRGLDYVQSRAYQPGDDLRAMHWALLARTGKPYVREYEQEQAQPWHALVDAHAGMLFGTRRRTKAGQAARAALLAAGLHARSQPLSALTCSLWSPQGLHTCSFGCGMAAVRRMAGWLMLQRITVPEVPVADPARSSLQLRSGIARWHRRGVPAGTLWLCSDFGWLDADAQAALQPLAASARCVAVQLLDAVELDLPKFDAAVMLDATSGRQGWLGSGPAQRLSYAGAAEAGRRRRRERLGELGMRVAEVRADVDTGRLHAALAGVAP